MTEIMIYNKKEFGKLRTLEIDGEPWFVGKDVAEALGYGEGKSPINAVANHVDEEDKGVTEIMTPGGMQKMTIINESGLYSLVLSSKLPSAKAFKRWITAEVIPSIRKHGGYLTPDKLEEALLNPDTLINLATALKQEREKRQALEEQRKIDHPKILFADAVSASKNSILVGELSKLIRQNGVDIGQNRLFSWLRQNGFLISRKGSDYNMPTQRAMDAGLFEIKETAVTHSDGHVTVSKTPKVTGKGQQYFVNKFLKGSVKVCLQESGPAAGSSKR